MHRILTAENGYQIIDEDDRVVFRGPYHACEDRLDVRENEQRCGVGRGGLGQRPRRVPREGLCGTPRRVFGSRRAGRLDGRH